MSKINDGGPAFPLSKDMALDPVTSLSGEDVSSGMSLLDYFSGQALAGICANPNFFGSIFQQSPIAAADFARQVGYAMLSARSDQGGGNG